MEEEREEAVSEERWAPIPDFDGFYEISDFGRVRNVKDRMHTFVGRLRVMGFDKDGYHQLCLTRPGKVKNIKIHRLVMSTFVGPRPEGYQINHKDCIKTNNRVDNLEYVTPSENRLHSYAVGSESQQGENNNGSKLTEENVHEIRRRLSAGETLAAIAASFNVSIGAIDGIARGVNWAYLKESDDDLTNASSQSTIADDRENERSENG